MDRRQFLFVAAAGAGTAAAGDLLKREQVPQKSAAASPRMPQVSKGAPNVLIFMPDQQNGATVLPGSPVIKPRMDAFLKESVAFTQAHCPAPHCCPSRASFMSGRYPSEHGVYNNVTTDTAIHANPYPGTPFWGLWLREAGYRMGYAGKLHVGNNISPRNCGFDNLGTQAQDGVEVNNLYKHDDWVAGRKAETDPAKRKPGELLSPDWGNLQMYRTLPDDSPVRNADVHIVEDGVAGLKNLAAGEQPWCLMVSNSGAHDAYVANKRYVDMYDLDKIELPPSFKDMLDDKPRIYQRQRYQYWSQMSDTETRDCIRHYYARCTQQDELFGRLLDALEETGQADNTIVLYVSDHGDYIGAHGLWFKGVPAFEEAYHIPWVMRWPKGVKRPGRQVDAFVDQVDFASTVLEACGIDPQQPISGRSLLPFLRDETPTDWRQSYCTQMNGVELYYTQRAVTSKDWKYVYNGFDYDELYDLKADPQQTRNLAFPDLTRKREEVLAGKGLPHNARLPWPALADARLETARKDLLTQMWTFAVAHNDTIFNNYGTVALAPYGLGLGPNPLDAPPAATGTP